MTKSGRRPKLYLAGPEVFLPDAVAVGEAKKAVCAAKGVEGLFPLDDPPDGDPGPGAIYARCLAMMRAADAIVANLTPFRGVGADPGTAFELGFMAAAGKPLFGYTNAADTLLDRTRAAERAGTLTLAAGASVEDFGHFDNLMLAEALAASGGIHRPQGPVGDPDRHLAVFEACIRSAAARLAGTR